MNGMKLGFRCPHCESRCTAVKTVQQHRLMYEVTYRCKNLYCGFIFVATLEAARVLSLSSTPRSDVDLPISRHVHLRLIGTQLDCVPVAEGADLDMPEPANRDLFEDTTEGPAHGP